MVLTLSNSHLQSLWFIFMMEVSVEVNSPAQLNIPFYSQALFTKKLLNDSFALMSTYI